MRQSRTIRPTVHLNGSSPERLVETNRAILAALREVSEKMQEALPHQRDYPARENEYSADLDEYLLRGLAVQSLIKAFESDLEYLVDQTS